MSDALHVLLIEDAPDDVELVIHELKRAGRELICEHVDNKANFLARLNSDIDVILADYNLPDFGALEALALVKESGLDVPLVVLTGSIGDEAAVECLRNGASDYLLKDRLARLDQALRHAVHEKELRVQARRAEQALRESEARYRRLAENAPDVIFRFQLVPTRTCEYISPMVTELLGYAPTDFYADPELLFNVVHPDDMILLEQWNQQGSHLSVPLAIRCIAKDGRVVWTEQRMTFIRDELGTLTAIEGIARDITERKRSEEALHKSERRFRLLFEESPIGIAIVRDGVLLYTNTAFVRMFEFGSDTELAGAQVKNLIAPPHRDEVLQRLANIEETLPISLEAYGQRKLGATFPMYMQITVIELADGLAQVVYISDMTISKQLQEETTKAEVLRMELLKEKELADLKERFTSMVSHEFRTPLTVIRMSTGLIKDFSDRFPPEKKQKFLIDIERQVQYMVELLDDVLTIGKTRAGKIEFSPEPLDLDSLCRDIVEHLQLTTGAAHNLLLANDTQAQMVYLDQHLLRHILVNLLSNAIKYSPKGGEVRLDVRSDDQNIVFEVTDHGIGIPDADQEHLFEPFHRGKNAQNIQGTGLGLAIVKGNVEAHGGTIAVRSAVGVGTTFSVQLPLISAISAA